MVNLCKHDVNEILILNKNIDQEVQSIQLPQSSGCVFGLLPFPKFHKSSNPYLLARDKDSISVIDIKNHKSYQIINSNFINVPSN